MIVLAVTGSMLLIAVAFVSGRQNKTEFQTAINELQQQLQQFANQTTSGQYTTDGSFSCNGTGSLISFQSTRKAQGTNENCIFLGNVIQFGTGTGDSASTLAVMPIVGKQFSSGLNPVETIQDAKPRAVYPLGSTEPASVAHTITNTDMQYGLSVADSSPNYCPSGGMCYVPVTGGAARTTGALGVIAGDGNGTLASSDGDNLKSGSQQFTLYGVGNNTTSPDQPTSAIAAAIGMGGSVPSPLVSASQAFICIQSGTTPQSGLFTITADWHITLQVFENATCTN